jgi:hypothetical protein
VSHLRDRADRFEFSASYVVSAKCAAAGTVISLTDRETILTADPEDS